MAKKPKQPHNNNNGDSNSGSGSGSGSSNIFKTLFGDNPEQQSSVSIFSDDNPFRRKPSDSSQTLHQQKKQQLGLGFGSPDDVGNTANGDFENPNSKRKRNKDKKRSLDLGSIDETSETHLEIKKSKKSEPKSSNFGVELEQRGEGEKCELGFDPKESFKRGKERKHKLGSESERGQGNDPSLGLELNGIVNLEVEGTEKKKKKKRKKDELEVEYEAQRYGVVASNDEDGEGGLGGKVVGEKKKKIDDPVDLMVPKEGFDDEAKLLRTVFVGNLPLKVKKKALFKEFSRFGEVESVRIRSVPLLDTKKPRKGAIIQKKINDVVDSVHAYIVFKTEQAAQASLAHNMAVVGENHIRVDRACPPRKKLKGENAPLYDNKRTVFVGNLPFDVKDEEIYQFFSGIKDLESSIEAIRVVRDPGSSAGKGIAYILFKTRGAANLLVKKRSLKLRDRELRLSHARSNITPSKRSNPSSTERDDFPAKKKAVEFKTPDSSSYQGVRASKSGVQKKVSKVIAPQKFKSRTQKVEKLKEWTGKRPAVAARKANALKGGSGSSKQTGKKHKLESRTSGPNKKIKKFR
ncbi:hypothetical protein TEA_002757 [Camellia sinensis var. sinensis]|uniref:RRM domain-containing protein n=1 Tax=Camellia sinensis var. sinensis TaxID=542762 RepID=A0A4S4EF22_CAMSN|nr:hypothetical protein TEA_002757 [Camellia sinensis var. sinensis]